MPTRSTGNARRPCPTLGCTRVAQRCRRGRLLCPPCFWRPPLLFRVLVFLFPAAPRTSFPHNWSRTRAPQVLRSRTLGASRTTGGHCALKAAEQHFSRVVLRSRPEKASRILEWSGRRATTPPASPFASFWTACPGKARLSTGSAQRKKTPPATAWGAATALPSTHQGQVRARALLRSAAPCSGGGCS